MTEIIYQLSPNYYLTTYEKNVTRKLDFCLCENKDADQLCSNCTAAQRLCFRYMDSTIPLLLKSEISSFYPTSRAAQAALCLAWSEIPKTGFLTLPLIKLLGDHKVTLYLTRPKCTPEFFNMLLTKCHQFSQKLLSLINLQLCSHCTADQICVFAIANAESGFLVMRFIKYTAKLLKKQNAPKYIKLTRLG